MTDSGLTGWLSGACADDDGPIGAAERMLMLSHVAERPSWDCGACGDPWPCLVARVSLKQHLSPEALRTTMALFVHTAASIDMPLDVALYARFYRWISDGEQKGPPEKAPEGPCLNGQKPAGASE